MVSLTDVDDDIMMMIMMLEIAMVSLTDVDDDIMMLML